MSEFVFGTHNAAFVQVMYEQYLRDPASVGEEWRQLFDNGKLAELPVIPTDRAEVLRDEGRGTRDGGMKGRIPRMISVLALSRCGRSSRSSSTARRVSCRTPITTS